MELGSDSSSTVKPSVAVAGLVEHGPDKSRVGSSHGCFYAMSLILRLPGHCKHYAGAGTALCPGPRSCCIAAKEVKVLTAYMGMHQKQRRRWGAS